MKKNAAGRVEAARSYTVPDYGHDRTIHSLGRGLYKRQSRQKRRRRVIALTALIMAIALATGSWLIWPMLPWFSGQTTTSGATTQTTATTSASTTQSDSSAASSETSATSSETSATQPTTTASTLSSEERATLLDEAATQATVLLKTKTGRFGVRFINLVSGETWSYQADQPFVAASSIKMGINTYLYMKIDTGDVSPEEMLTYDNRPYSLGGDYEAGTGTIQGMPNGTQLSVRETSRLSIRISDNCGTNMIIRRLGGIDTINSFLKTVSSVVDYRAVVSYKDYAGNSQSGHHRTSATDLAAYAEKLYRLWQEKPAAYQPLIDDLSHTEFDFGIQKGIPSEIQVAHKIGTNGAYSAENDVGIVFASEPYVLCIMTEMSSAEAARKVQADISTIFYTYIESLK
jgi:beta-lactamase class A